MAAITMISITLLMRTMKINALTLDGLEVPRDRLVIRAAELGSLSSRAKVAMKIFVKRVFTIRKSRQILIRDKIAYVRA